MDEEQRRISRSLVWWKPPSEVDFLYLIRRIMEMGTPDMLDWLGRRHGEAVMRQALAMAEPGNLSERSWNYWHVVFDIRPTPTMPQRYIPNIPYVSAETGRAAPGAAGPLAEAR